MTEFILHTLVYYPERGLIILALLSTLYFGFVRWLELRKPIAKINLAPPAGAEDQVTKSYVDNQLGELK